MAYAPISSITSTRNTSSDITPYSNYVYPVNQLYIDKNCYRSGVINSLDMHNVPVVNNDLSLAFQSSPIRSVTNINNNVTNMYYAFQQCVRIDTVTIPNSVVDMSFTFADSGIRNGPDLSNCTNLTNMCGTFSYCTYLENAPAIIPNSVTDMYKTFYSCPSLTNGPISISTAVTNMEETFAQTSIINGPNMSNCTNLTDMERTFYSCQALVNGPNLSNCTNLTSMAATFEDCTNLTTAPTIPPSVIEIARLFRGCANLRGDIYILSENIESISQIFLGSDTYQKNVYIPFKYANNEDTLTYETFTDVGYDEIGSRDNVYLKDLSTL